MRADPVELALLVDVGGDCEGEEGDDGHDGADEDVSGRGVNAEERL